MLVPLSFVAAPLDVFHTRWLPDERTVACYHGNVRCPAHVTPKFLEEAKGQGVCENERDKYYCNAACTRDGQVNWLGAVCPNDLVTPCPPWKRTVIPEYDPSHEAAPPTILHGPEPAPAASSTGAAVATGATQPGAAAPALRGDKFSGAAMVAAATTADVALITATGGFDLRGAFVRQSLHCVEMGGTRGEEGDR